MNFLYPGFLWALSLVLIPVIIHLFNFRRYKTLYFSSLQFIKHVDQKTKSTQQLKHILILISRILAITFLVLAFAQPYSDSEKATSAPDAPVYCFYIDNSYSMQAHGHEGELLSEAREKAKEIVEKAPVDALFMIGTNEMSGREEHLLNKADALDKIDHIELMPVSRPLDQILSRQENALKKAMEASSLRSEVQYLLFSDFQKHNSDPEKRTKTGYNYFPVQLIPESRDNVLIDSVWFESPLNKINKSNQLNIRIANYSDHDRSNIELNVNLGKMRKTIFTDIPAGEKSTSSFTFQEKESGFVEGKVVLNDKQIFFDDSYYFSYEVKANSSVLIIDGEDAVDNIEVLFSLDNYYTVSRTAITALTKEVLNKADLVVINGAGSIPSGIQSYLLEYSKNGGSLALFPAREPVLNEWNTLLQNLQMPLLGNTLRSGTKIRNINYKDPFFQGVFEKETSDLNLPSVNAVFQSKQGNALSNTLVELQNGMPLLSYRRENGSLLLFCSSLHPDYGKFTQDALFTTVLLRMGELSQRKQPLSVTIGQELLYPVYRSINNDKAVNIKGTEYEFIPLLSESGGVNYISLRSADANNAIPAGNYKIIQDEQLGSLSLNNDRKESDLETYSETEIIQIFGAVNANKVKLNSISSASTFSTKDIDNALSYWKICIIITLIFVATEMLLVRFLK